VSKQEVDGYVLTTGDVARIYGLHRNTVINMARDGRLPSIRLGTPTRARYRFRPSQVLAYFDAAVRWREQ
jgi:excisionase family DNA binding protein